MQWRWMGNPDPTGVALVPLNLSQVGEVHWPELGKRWSILPEKRVDGFDCPPMEPFHPGRQKKPLGWQKHVDSVRWPGQHTLMKRTVEGHELTNLILETFRLNGALLAAGNTLTKPFELTSARWQILGPIFSHAEPMTVAQIARRMGLSRQGVQRIVNDLKNLGIVEFLNNPDHKRAPLISLSEAGRQVMVALDNAQAAWVNQLAEGLGERQIKQALKVLETVREKLDGSNDA